MTVKNAYKKVCEFVNDTPAVLGCRVYDDAYAFAIGPKGSGNKRMFAASVLYCVNKTTGKVFTSNDDEYKTIFGKIWRGAKKSDLMELRAISNTGYVSKFV